MATGRRSAIGSIGQGCISNARRGLHQLRVRDNDEGGRSGINYPETHPPGRRRHHGRRFVGQQELVGGGGIGIWKNEASEVGASTRSANDTLNIIQILYIETSYRCWHSV